MNADELALIRIFANRMRSTRSNVIALREIVEAWDRDRRAALTEAMQSLSSRGWLVTSAPARGEDDQECVLLGDGLRIVQEMKAQPMEGEPSADSDEDAEEDPDASACGAK